jgi:tryptophanyl-tRNA synthetase
MSHPASTRRLSLIKPTGHLTLGNYLGALRAMASEQRRSTCFFGIADLHALTVAHDPRRLRTLTQEVATLMLACGLDPDHATLFVQGQVPAHSELSYLLESTVYTGELNRMIQFKEKGRDRPQTRASLYTYPALMAADILLYRTSEVPVGDDQRQHVELTRDLAVRFNTMYGEVFTVPAITTPPSAARVMDLQDPTTKMGKSHESGAGIIYLLDEPAVVRRKIARAVTDSETGADAVRHDPTAKPGVSNLLEIISGCESQEPAQAAAGLSSYGDLKQLTTEAVLLVLEPVQERYAELAARPELVAKTYLEGARRCREESAPVLAAARQAIGLLS